MKKTMLVWLLLAVTGGFCYLLQLIYGAGITNMHNFLPWGLYIAGFMIFTGIAAGSLLLAGSAWLVDELAPFRPLGKIMTFAGVFGGLAGAGLFIMVDMGNPQRGIYMLVSPNLSSPQVWDAMILSLYGLVGSCFMYRLWQFYQGKITAAKVKPVAGLAVIAGLMVVVTSFAFVLLVSSPGWNNPGEALSFLFAALIAAFAVQLLVLQHLRLVKYIELEQKVVSWLAGSMIVLLTLELLYIAAETAIGLYAPYGEEAAGVHWQLMGKGAPFYWLTILVSMAAIGSLGRSYWRMGSYLALLSVLLIKYNLLQTEQLNPLLPYAGPSVYNPPALGIYVPSLVEWGTAIGIAAAVCLMVAMAFIRYKKFFVVQGAWK